MCEWMWMFSACWHIVQCLMAVSLFGPLPLLLPHPHSPLSLFLILTLFSSQQWCFYWLWKGCDNVDLSKMLDSVLPTRLMQQELVFVFFFYVFLSSWLTGGKNTWRHHNVGICLLSMTPGPPRCQRGGGASMDDSVCTFVLICIQCCCWLS